MNKNQIIYIRGGEVFGNTQDFYEYLKNREYNPYAQEKSWRDWVAWALSENFEVFEPQMPNKQWADYQAWKIWFEKLFPYLGDEKIILIGSSLGGSFLVKYLSENAFPKKIHQIHVIAPVFNDTHLDGEILGNFAAEARNMRNIETICKKIFLYYSTDDTIVPVYHPKKYMEHMRFAEVFEFHNKKHFNQPAFQELLDTIYKYL